MDSALPDISYLFSLNSSQTGPEFDAIRTELEKLKVLYNALSQTLPSDARRLAARALNNAACALRDSACDINDRNDPEKLAKLTASRASE